MLLLRSHRPRSLDYRNAAAAATAEAMWTDNNHFGGRPLHPTVHIKDLDLDALFARLFCLCHCALHYKGNPNLSISRQVREWVTVLRPIGLFGKSGVVSKSLQWRRGVPPRLTERCAREVPVDPPGRPGGWARRSFLVSFRRLGQRACAPGGLLPGLRLGLDLLAGSELAHGRAAQFQPMGAVDDAIEDGVGLAHGPPRSTPGVSRLVRPETTPPSIPTNPATGPRILRTIIVEIIARVDGNQIDLMIHWQGGDHTQLKVRRPALDHSSSFWFVRMPEIADEVEHQGVSGHRQTVSRQEFAQLTETGSSEMSSSRKV
jgi:hypothetical protein